MRRIELLGANNARNFLGLTNKDGLKIRNPQYIRSNGLSNLTPEDVAALQAQGLRRVIDLRTHSELVERPNVQIDGVEYIHIPLIDESSLGITHDKETRRKLEENPTIILDLEAMYVHLVTNESAVSQMAKVFDVILSADEGATLWHCAAGKDRCGLVSALFLKLLDVDEEVIRDDYLLTNENSRPKADAIYEAVMKKTGDADIAEHYRMLELADLSYIVAAVRAVEEKWGSVDRFIQEQLGISKENMRNLQNRVLES